MAAGSRVEKVRKILKHQAHWRIQLCTPREEGDSTANPAQCPNKKSRGHNSLLKLKGSAHFTLQKPRWYQHLCAELFGGHEVVTGQGSESAVQLNRTSILKCNLN
jgi:hypothetical protein